MILRKQKDQGEVLQASATLDSKTTDSSFFHPNKIPVFTVNMMNRNSILGDLCTSRGRSPRPLSPLLPHLLFILQCDKVSRGRVLQKIHAWGFIPAFVMNYGSIEPASCYTIRNISTRRLQGSPQLSSAGEGLGRMQVLAQRGARGTRYKGCL